MGGGALLNPAPGERVIVPPFLVWTPVAGATYYNVVLIRGRRVFSAWPVRTRLQLPRSWVYRGQRQRLRPGLYRWYVWPVTGGLGGPLRPPAGRQHVRRHPLSAALESTRAEIGEEGRVAQDEDEQGEPADEQQAIRVAASPPDPRPTRTVPPVVGTRAIAT